mgnify:CR=1 FL=1
MGKQHVHRISAPKTWAIHRKEIKFITRPNPGSNKLEHSISLNTLLKEMLSHAKTSRECKQILNSGKILVNKKIRKNPKFQAGLLDVISMEDLKEYYRILINKKGKLIVKKITKEEANIKPLRVLNKTVLKGKKLQLNLSSGYNIITDKNDINVSDTIIFDMQKNKIDHIIKLEKGALIYLINGSKIGHMGTLQDIRNFKGMQNPIITFTIGKDKFETLKEYAIVIGKDKPLISIENEE